MNQINVDRIINETFEDDNQASEEQIQKNKRIDQMRQRAMAKIDYERVGEMMDKNVSCREDRVRHERKKRDFVLEQQIMYQRIQEEARQKSLERAKNILDIPISKPTKLLQMDVILNNRRKMQGTATPLEIQSSLGGSSTPLPTQKTPSINTFTSSITQIRNKHQISFGLRNNAESAEGSQMQYVSTFNQMLKPSQTSSS